MRACRPPRSGAVGGTLAALMMSCGGGAPPPEPELLAPPPPPLTSGAPRLLILSSLMGFIEPCGCTVDLQLGGIDRIASVVADERKQGPALVLVAGPTLLPPKLKPYLVAQEEAKARLLARSLERIGVDAFVPSATELQRGEAFYQELRGLWSAPDVTANVAHGAGRIVDVGGLKVGVFGLADPNAGPVPAGQVGEVGEATQREATRLRGEGAQVVVGVAGFGRRELRRVATKAKVVVDIWVLAESPKEATVVSPAGDSFILEAGDRGRYVGQAVLLDAGLAGALRDPRGDWERQKRSLSLQIEYRRAIVNRGDGADADSARQLAELGDQRYLLEKQGPDDSGRRLVWGLLPVPKITPPDEQIAEWITAYNEDLRRINARPLVASQVPEGGSGYVGAAACSGCHPKAQAQWKETRHARAWKTLVDADKTFDAECVSCHVTGWQEPGGAVMGALGLLQSVGCEACHGPGSRHAADGEPSLTARDAPTAVCETCHHPHHSPKFDYRKYRPKILGPGHGG